MTESAQQDAHLLGVLYVSSAAGPMPSGALAEILTVSRDRNQSDGVSGLLLYRSGNFMQYLEGPREAVVRTKARIYRDPRHGGIITVAELPTTARRFAGWSMGFANCDDPAIRAMDGFSRFLDLDFRGEAVAGAADYALRMLEHFRDKMR